MVPADAVFWLGRAWTRGFCFWSTYVTKQIKRATILSNGEEKIKGSLSITGIE
jgi:hypothetical protein